MQLPILDCNDCGACCMEISSPPFLPDELNELPVDLREDYLAQCEKIEWDDDERPCFWFDVESKRCRHYENRPEVCQEFEVGCDACHGWREQFKVGEA